MTNLIIILPSLDPDAKFSKVVSGLLEAGFKKILIVDDGSSDDEQHFFDEAAAHPECTVLHHGINKGKGRALKTAFAYVTENFPDAEGVITIDGDGQHLIKDIISCGKKLIENPGKVILGCRNFKQSGIPGKSLAGNRTTSFLFRVCCGIKLSDTQTGLRAIPSEYLPLFCSIDGERFDYETNMLLTMKRKGIDFIEQPIETVYEDNNKGTHYRPFADSWRIAKVLIKFLLSSGSAVLIDFIVCYLVHRLFDGPLGTASPLVANVAGKGISSFVNFNANKRIVFENKGNYKRSLIRYYALWLCQTVLSTLISYGFISLITHLWGNSSPLVSTLVRIPGDILLFFISYNLQREWVFSDKTV